MNAALNSIAAFVIAHLPDSLAERKALLGALVLVLPNRHPLRDRVHALRLLLESHEQQQLKLSLDFSQATLPAKDGESK